MLNLDLKDRKILYELDLNSRQSFHELAKKVGLSKDSVIYRINKLKEAGVIKQFHTLIDAGKLGFISFRLYLKFQNTTPETESELIEFLKKQDVVVWIASSEGDYDLCLLCLARSIREMNQLWKDFFSNYRNFIEKKLLTIFTKVSYYPRADILGKKQNFEEFVFVTEPENIALGQEDTELLRLIAPDSRISVLEIAKELNITPKTASKRIKDLENRGVILGYRTMFDIEKLGYQYYKVHFNLQSLTKEQERAFRMFIKQHPGIIYDNEVLGGDDIEIDVQVKSVQDFRKLIAEIKERFSSIIRNYHYRLIYQEHKYVFFPLD